ncbi:hypothetical protein Q7C36_023098 [Tachysurus vachellii]|uniref:Uncharacterized protein n=1 Tax=Tachysurus vachellii TaxID=175792 RepID=A0AA88IZS6_TACVA|nr:hypothetical protein Q7C36_023098 [Tachysurus vachellii]
MWQGANSSACSPSFSPVRTLPAFVRARQQMVGHYNSDSPSHLAGTLDSGGKSTRGAGASTRPACRCHSVMFVCPVTGPLALVHSAMFGQDPMQQAGRAVGHGRSLGVLLQSQERSLLPSSTPRGLLPASAGPHKEETTSTKALFIPADPDSSTLRKKEGENGLCIGGFHYLRHGDTYQISSGL